MLRLPTLSRVVGLALLLAASIGLSVDGGSAAESVTAPAVLIIDSSGSMAAREPDDRIKLDAAREVTLKALESWPADGQLAVIAYGHRRTSDCSDIETIVPMGPVSVGAIKQSLGSLRARGKTPISESLRAAATLLSADGGAIVLVSDGLETCEADPCAVAASLKAANTRLFIHVVGFGLAEGEAPQLACIAESAGGRFFDAGTADDLASALTSVVETVAAEPPPPEPPAALPEVESPPPVEPAAVPVPEPPPIVRVGLVAVAGGLGSIVKAPVRWSVRDAASTIVYEGESRGLSLDLAAGSYEVEAQAANAQGIATIEVTGAQGQSFDVEVMAGRLDLSLSSSKVAPPFADVEAAGIIWTLEPKDGQGAVKVLPLARPSLLLAPGRYAVRAQLKGLEAFAEVEVTAGTAIGAALDFRLGTLVLEASLGAEDPPIADAALLGWRIGEGDKAQSISGEARPRVVLPEGNYPVVLTIAGGEVAATAEVKAGEEHVVRVVVGGGELALSARLAPDAPPLEDWRDTFWTITAEDGLAAGTVIELPAAAPIVPVPPGRWRVSLLSGTVTVERQVTIGPGDSTPLSVSLDAARLTISAAPADGSERSGNTVFRVVSLAADGAVGETPVYSSGASEQVSTILAAGRWRILAIDSADRKGEADITLGGGEERTVDIPLK